jgi:superfamily I DNA and RNA helicase
MLQRNLIYTAITRAKKVCFVVGGEESVRTAIRNTKAKKRNTMLGLFMQQEMESRGKERAAEKEGRTKECLQEDPEDQGTVVPE